MSAENNSISSHQISSHQISNRQIDKTNVAEHVDENVAELESEHEILSISENISGNAVQNSFENGFEVEVRLTELLVALSFVTSIIEKRNVKPILSCVCFKTQGNQLNIHSTDGTLFATNSVKAKIINQGVIAVEGLILLRILNKLKDEFINLAYLPKSQELKVYTPTFELKLVTLDVKEFPEYPKLNTESIFDIQNKDLCSLIDHTSFSCSKEEIRYNINGIYLHSSEANDKVCAVSTDGNRLSTAEIELKTSNQFKFILPFKTIEFLKKLSNGKFEKFATSVRVSHNLIEFISQNLQIVSKLVDANFPEYKNLIPNANPYELKVKHNLLLESVERIAEITDERFRSIKMRVQKNTLEISSYLQSKGGAKEVLSEIEYNGEEILIGLNPRYLLEILKLLKSSDEAEISIKLKNSSSSLLITINNLPCCRFVVMPIQL